MCVCVCVCVCAGVCLCVHVCMCVCVHVCMSSYTRGTCVSRIHQSVFSFFASQTLHNRKISKNKTGDLSQPTRTKEHNTN